MILLAVWLIWIAGAVILAGYAEERRLPPEDAIFPVLFWPLAPLYFLGRWLARR